MTSLLHATGRSAIRIFRRPPTPVWLGAAWLAAVALSSCAKLSPGGASLGDPCLVSSDCADPYICVDGRCTPSAGQLCTATTLRCNGDDVEQCDPSGDAWTVVQSCTIGCVEGACVPATCSPGVQQCEQNNITECLSDGSQTVPVQTCPTTCVPSTTDPTKAECSEPVCAPFETQCNSAMPGMLETCSSNGTTWNSASCAVNATNPSQTFACVSGQCELIVCTTTPDPSNAGSFVRQQQCDGVVAEQCNDTGTAYEAQVNGVCANGCAATPDGGYGCVSQTCLPFSTTCDTHDPTGTTLFTCNPQGTMQNATTCAVPDGQAICAQGPGGAVCTTLVCNVSKDQNGNITGRDQQCSGNLLQQCDDQQTGWENLSTCAFGCLNGPPGTVLDGGVSLETATCGTAACSPGQGECAASQTGSLGQPLELCNPDQSGFSFVEYCPSGCTESTSGTITVATCNPPVCAALTRCCAGDPTVDCPTDPTNPSAPAVFVCSSDGSGYEEVEVCSQSCAAGACIVTGVQCNPGDVQCDGQEVQQCVMLSDGTANWEFVEQCLDTCVSGACSSGGACGCNPPVEALTLAGQCGGAGSGAPQPIQLEALLPGACNAEVPCATAGTTCVNGACAPTCVMDSDCNVAVPGATCLNGACTPDCSTNAQCLVPGTVCLAGTCEPQEPCGDGVSLSTVLLYTLPITDQFGTVVPDGTMVTFANDAADGASPDNLIMSADADPAQAGIQRATQNGIAIATLAAPAVGNCGGPGVGARTVTVTASIGGGVSSCAGTVPVFFDAVSSTQLLTSRTVYIAQDFSSTTADDAINTPAPQAAWSTVASAAVSLPGFDLGTGTDGNATIPSLPASASCFNQAGYFCMDQSAWAPSWNVTAITAQGASIDGASESLHVGDEVLVATTWGPSGSTGPGNYEFHHVAALSGSAGYGSIQFAEPINTLFGNGTNGVLSGHRIVLQRVPQFTSLNVPSGITLTASPVSTTAGCGTTCTPTGGTGILAFRVSGTLTVSGGISMDDAGLPANLAYYPNTASTPSLNRLLEGLPAALTGMGVNSGGGVIYIAAGVVSFGSGAATIHADIGSGGSAGTVWVSGATLQFSGQTRVLATGGSTGHTRLDYSTSDFTSNPPPQSAVPNGTTFVGPESGGEYVQSRTVFLETTMLAASQATVYGVLGGSGFTSVGTSPPPSATDQLIPGVNVWLSSDGATTWGGAAVDVPSALVDNGSVTFEPGLTMGSQGLSGAGKDIRFRLQLAPPAGAPLEVRGLAFSVLMK